MPDIYIAKENQSEKTPPVLKPAKPGEKNGFSKDGVTKAEKEVVKEASGLKSRTRNPLAAFVSRPLNLRFETQERREKIILLLRRHWVTNVSWIAAAVLLLFGFLFLRLIPFWDGLSGAYRLIIVIVYYLMLFAFSFEKFLTWFFNVNIITDERIIDIDFHSILYKDLSEMKIDQIQDVNIRVGGFTRSLFNFGDVTIQTAGAEQQICFEAVPNPEQVSKVLNVLILQEEKEKIEGRVR